MLGALCEPRIWFRVRVSICGKRVPKDRECREPSCQGERPVREGDVMTCLIQIVNKPAQIMLLKVFHALYIVLAVKCIVESIGELG